MKSLNIKCKFYTIIIVILAALFFIIPGCKNPGPGPEPEEDDPLLELGVPVESDVSTYSTDDSYRLNVTEGQGYIISWEDENNSTAYTADATVRIFDDSNGLIGDNDDTPIMFTAAATATYKIRVGAEYSGSGTYRIRADSAVVPTSLTLDFTSLSMESGDTQLLTATTTPADANQNKEWTSSDTDVVRVTDDGLVVAQFPGTAQITVTSVIDNSVSAVCDVTVAGCPISVGIPVEGEVENNCSVYYALSVLDGVTYDISWLESTPYTSSIRVGLSDSENNTLITLDSYSPLSDYTADSDGTVFIEVEEYLSAGTFQLSVQSNLPPTVLIPQETDVTMASGESSQIALTVQPTGASAQATWTSSDTNVVSVSSSGVLLAKRPGTAVISIESTLEASVTASVNVTVTALSITPGTPVEGNVLSGGYVYYRLDVADGNQYIISWDEDSPYTSDIRVGLMDSLFGLIKSYDTTTPMSDYIADLDGYVYIVVDEYSPAGTYQLSVEAFVPPVTLIPQESIVAINSGDISQIVVTATPANGCTDVSYSSSNTTVVSVDSTGSLLAKRPGTAEITIESDLDNSVTATVDVTVSPLTITPGTPVEGTIPDDCYMYYSLNVVDDNLYRISWDEDSPYTSSIRVGLLDSSFSSLKSYDTTTPLSDYIADYSGIAYVVVDEYYGEGTFQLTVEEYLPPTSLNLSETSVTLNRLETEQLTVTALPSGSSDLVDWSSSDTSVATVSSTGLVSAVTPGTADITVTSDLDASVSSVCTVTVNEPTKATAWTVMLYSDADNDLELALLLDIQEIKDGLQAGADINVVLLIDRISGETSDSSVLGENFTTTRLYRILPGDYYRLDGETQFPEITKTSNYEANMGDAETLQKFIQFCKAEYPASNYALILSNHGNGARNAQGSSLPMSIDMSIEKSICSDDTNDDSIYTAEISDVLTSSESVDLLIFDACLMGTAEVAYQYCPDRSGVTFSADYLLASAPNVWGYGLDYENAFMRMNTIGGNNGNSDTTLGGLEENFDPATMTAEQMAAVFLEEQRDLVNAQAVDHQSFTLLDLSLVDEVKTAVDALAIQLTGSTNLATMETVRGSLSATNVIDYFDETDEDKWGFVPYFDLYDLALETEAAYSGNTAVTSAASAVMTAVDNAILYSFAGSDYSGFTEGTCGLSIFFPDGDRNYEGDIHWVFQWWYNSIDTAAINSSLKYGKIAWCIDGQNTAINTVGNWFELLDSWYDPTNTSSGGYNGFQW